MQVTGMAKDSREKLMGAATQLFAEKGFSGVSIRELAAAAGVNSSLISYHFGGKEGLYEAVVASQYERVIGRFEKIATAPGTARDKIRMYAEVIRLNHTVDQPFMARLIQGELSMPTACLENVIRKYTARMAQVVTGIIQEGMDKGEFRTDIPPIFAAVSLAGMCNFYFVLREITKAVLPESEKQDSAFIEAALQIYLKGMGRN